MNLKKSIVVLMVTSMAVGLALTGVSTTEVSASTKTENNIVKHFRSYIGSKKDHYGDNMTAANWDTARYWKSWNAKHVNKKYIVAGIKHYHIKSASKKNLGKVATYVGNHGKPAKGWKKHYEKLVKTMGGKVKAIKWNTSKSQFATMSYDTEDGNRMYETFQTVSGWMHG